MSTLSRLLRPAPMIIIPVLVSALAWLVPGASQPLRGFGDRAEVSVGAVFVMAVFYGVTLLLASAGSVLGRAMRPIASLEKSDDPRVEYRILVITSILAAVGVAYVVLGSGGIEAFRSALEATDANSLKDATGGSAGIATLRYGTVVAAPMSWVLLLERRRGVALAVLNTIMLVVSSAVASRLSLLMAVVVFLTLVVARKSVPKVRVRWLVALGLAGAALLTLMNYWRNARYYLSYGVSDPWSMSAYQALAYAGSPFQVQLGLAGNLGVFTSQISAQDSPIGVLVPTFFRNSGLDSGSVGVAERYGYVVDIAPWLTTNSAFADLLAAYGVLGLVLALIPVAVFGFIFGHFIQYRGLVAASAGVALYAFAEVWRIYLFNQGIAIFAAILPIGVTLVAIMLPMKASTTSARRARERASRSLSSASRSRVGVGPDDPRKRVPLAPREHSRRRIGGR